MREDWWREKEREKLGKTKKNLRHFQSGKNRGEKEMYVLTRKQGVKRKAQGCFKQ